MSWGRWAGISLLACTSSIVHSADSPERYTVCAEETRIVHEISPRLVLNDFGTANQTIVGIGYGFSKCLGDTQDRLRLEASYDHVDEEHFHADAAVLSAGVELHPWRRNTDFVMVPRVFLGKEYFRGGGSNTVYGASLILSQVVRLSEAERSVGDTSITIADSQLVLDFRGDYVDRHSSDGTIVSNGGGQLAFYGAVGLDQAVAGSNWRWTARAGYQTLGRGPIDGFAQLSLAVRRLNGNYTNYPWNAQIGVNLGDHGYRALLLGFSLRFASGRQPTVD